MKNNFPLRRGNAVTVGEMLVNSWHWCREEKSTNFTFPSSPIRRFREPACKSGSISLVLFARNNYNNWPCGFLSFSKIFNTWECMRESVFSNKLVNNCNPNHFLPWRDLQGLWRDSRGREPLIFVSGGFFFFFFGNPIAHSAWPG